MEAECLIANFIVTHELSNPISKTINFLLEQNLPISDHMTNFIKHTILDSNIATKYQRNRTETTHYFHAMSQEINSSIGKILNTGPLSVAKDSLNSESIQL